MKIRLDQIAFDAGTQIRASIDESTVAKYAEAMLITPFPPIVLFHDGNKHYLADGFHRYMAAQRNKWREIDADVQPGTKEDALWFALGANKHGRTLTSTDLQHAIRLAFNTWPNRSTTQIADQVGCTQQYVSGLRNKQVTTTCNVLPKIVTGKDGKTYPASTRISQEKAAEIERLLLAGHGTVAIMKAVKSSQHTIDRIRKRLGLAKKRDHTPEAKKQRRKQMREMAAGGHTSIQIAGALGLSLEGCRDVMRAEGIDVPADRATRNSRHIKSNRILETMVMDAENLTAAVNLIQFSELDRVRLDEWVDSLIASKKSLDAFIRRLMKEKQKHGQAA